MMGLLTAALADQARHERDRRAASYPDKIARGADAEALCLDYQCWVAIAEWLETDRFTSFAGGADPDQPDAPVIRWPELVAAAERAGGSVRGDNQAAELRRARLTAIHRMLELRAESVAIINAELRKPRELAA
jgi:hypothetical protein